MEVQAKARYVRVAPNKARQVIAHIRGLRIEEARRVLAFSPKGIAGQILKTLDSAVANAENNNDLDADDLVVVRAVVDEGPTLKRYQPRAMGRAYRIRKRTSHITIGVAVPAAVAAAATPAPTATKSAAPKGRGTTAEAAESTDSATAEASADDTSPKGEEE